MYMKKTEFPIFSCHVFWTSETFLITPESPAAVTDSFIYALATSWIPLDPSVKPLDTLHLPAAIGFDLFQPLRRKLLQVAASCQISTRLH